MIQLNNFLKLKKKLTQKEWDKLSFSQSTFFNRHNGQVVRCIPESGGPNCAVLGFAIPDFIVDSYLSEAQVQNHIFRLVSREIERARAKHTNNEFMHTALTEETGELAQAIIDTARHNDTLDHALEEAIQVMAVTYRLITEGSREWPFRCLMNGTHSSTMEEPDGG
jgi:NTP pyrophosphatase (non-canonical NTP hydrolase)